MLRTTLKRIGLYRAIMANGLYILLLCLIAAAVVALTIAKPIVFSRIIDEGILNEDWGEVQSHCIYRIQFVLNNLGFDVDVEDLPAGLDTNIAEGGSNFSGGQRQKIAIARAVVKDTPIYIFDEPLSNLDVRSRGLALAYLKNELKGKIVLIVSHDDIGGYTDREYKMEDGTIVATAVNGFERVSKNGPNALHLSV